MTALPDRFETIEALEEFMSRPPPRLVEFLATVPGDFLFLGAGGKIGPTMVRMTRRALDEAGRRDEVTAVDRAPRGLEGIPGVKTIRCDLLDPGAMQMLPRAQNVVFLAGRKFGSGGHEHLTWAANVLAPHHLCRHADTAFPDARIVAFSTGCVYPLMHVSTGGATEETPPDPVGEYAMSCLGRERVFEHASRSRGLKVALVRLNYAVELRYGVLVDVATRVWNGEPVDVTTGYANVIWQGDACSQILECLGLAASPPAILNITGPELLRVREVALRFGTLLDREVRFRSVENGIAYLSNAARSHALFGPPAVPLDRIIEWTAHWIRIGGATLGLPTHFEAQDGDY